MKQPKSEGAFDVTPKVLYPNNFGSGKKVPLHHEENDSNLKLRNDNLDRVSKLIGPTQTIL